MTVRAANVYVGMALLGGLVGAAVGLLVAPAPGTETRRRVVGRSSEDREVVLRRAACDAELAGTPIAAGDTLALLLGSANRDERRFAEPDRFDLRREGGGHLAFGWGTHFCLGARLARNEAGAALGALLARADKLELAGDGVDRVASPMFRGPRELRLRFQPRCSP